MTKKFFQRRVGLSAALVLATSALGALLWAASPDLALQDSAQDSAQDLARQPATTIKTEEIPFVGAAKMEREELDAKIAAISLDKYYPEEQQYESERIVRNLREAALYDDACAFLKGCVRLGAVEGLTPDKYCRTLLEIVAERGDPKKLEAEIEAAFVDYPQLSWRLAPVLADFYQHHLPHAGSLIDGVFERAVYNGEHYNSTCRDRVRVLQFYRDSLPEAERAFAAWLENPTSDSKRDANALRSFYSCFVDDIARYEGESIENAFWRRQKKTDLDVLPEIETQNNYWDRMNSNSNVGAPVDADGNPIVFGVPESFDAAANDGERICWLRERSAAISVDAKISVLFDRASEARELFGPQTLARYNYFFRDDRTTDEDADAQDGVWSLATLTESETIARRSDGIKRFEFPKGYNYFDLWREIVDLAREEKQEETIRGALFNLADEYLNRRQFEKAAETLKEILAAYPENEKASDDYKRCLDKYESIVGAWGRIDANSSKVLGPDVVLSYLFRNGTEAKFVVKEVRVDRLIEDLQTSWNKERTFKNGFDGSDSLSTSTLYNYFWSDPQRLFLQEKDGVQSENKRYVGDELANWTVELEPAPGHYDRRVDVEFPKELGAGAYLVEVQMKDGNRDYVFLWTTDVAIYSKDMRDGRLYFFADATTGAPQANLDVDIFATTLKWERRAPTAKEKQNGILSEFFRYVTKTRWFSKTTDAEGQFILSSKDEKPWSAVVRDPSFSFYALAVVKPKDGSRPSQYAFLGMSPIARFTDYNTPTLNNVASYFVSDRPIYRPEQTAQFKFWVGTARYDSPDASQWAGKTVRYEIYNPTGEKAQEKEVVLDEFGGLADSFKIPADAKLGVYRVQLWGNLPDSYQNYYLGDGYFRLEEYRKPEYEVVVDAPKEPVALGDKIKATITAKYYFGAPVKNATVSYKVQRTKYVADWIPPRYWDWFYGPGYWWFAYDCDWYPGWRRWGCPRPAPYWRPRSSGVPELVLEGTAELNDEGKFELEIDSELAKTLFPNDDQQYEITAEVVDQSRRTIVGTGNVFAAKEPFKVYTWVDRGFYEAEQKITASFKTRRLDGKPVLGTATVRLLKVEYESTADEDAERIDETTGIRPVETEVFSQRVEMKEDGSGSVELSAATPGQYRISCVVETEGGLREEGGQLFVVRGSSVRSEANASSKEASGVSAFRFGDLELIPEKSEYKVGETVRLQVSTARPDSTVLLYVRSVDGFPLEAPRTLKLENGTTCVEFKVELSDMPNFFVEAATVSNGQVYTELKEIVVPPESRVLDVEVLPSQERVRPGETAKIRLRLTDPDGAPVVGQTVATVYDKSLEQISGGSNVGDIRERFWKWRRQTFANCEHNLLRMIQNIYLNNAPQMQTLGVFGDELFSLDAGSNGAMAGGFGGAMAGLGGVRKSFSLTKRDEKSSVMLMEDSADAAPAPMASTSFALESDAPMQKLEAESVVSSLDAAKEEGYSDFDDALEQNANAEPVFVGATVRKNLADLAFWAADLTANDDGIIEIEVPMPENLTTWKIAAWTVGPGLRVGSGTSEIVTSKDVIVRMQKPRFLVQKDEAVLSAIVHNYLDSEKTVRVALEFPELTSDAQGSESVENARLAFVATDESEANAATRTLVVPAGGEIRVDWTVRAETAGTATLLMKALTDEESDAIQESVPVYVHGIMKQIPSSGAVFARSDAEQSGENVAETAENAKKQAQEPRDATFRLTVPEERLPETTKLTVRFSPSLAGAIFDALPYMIEYPYGCTEQTLNRFLPLIIAQKTLQDQGLDLAAFAERRANLNAQEIGDAQKRAERWNKTGADAVFNLEKARAFADSGIEKLTSMQNSDGGWGWFYGSGEYSQAYLTALVFRGLATALDCDRPVDQNVYVAAQNWLLNYQREQATKILRGKLWSDEKKKKSGGQWKACADAADAFVYFALVDAGFCPPPFDSAFVDVENVVINDVKGAQAVMKEYLWEQRAEMQLFPLASFGLALLEEAESPTDGSIQDEIVKMRETDQVRVETILRRLAQYRKIDDENQTVWLDLNRVGDWLFWRWDGSEFETQAFYLRLLNRADRATLEKLGLENDAPRLVKYLLNNRKNATYWNSTRDTALCVEAFSEYLRETNELATDAKVEVYVDDELKKTVEYSSETIFDVDGTLELAGDELSSGDHEITLRLIGDGALYYNAYLEFFTLEDPIEKAGLEVKTERRYYKLVERKDAAETVAAVRGQAVAQRVEKYDRVPLATGDEIASGDLVEVELIVESKNEYESILLEDMKAAGFEPVDQLSGYNGNALGAYVEYRDERVCFFILRLPQGKSSVAYRLRAETPGKFSALPTKIWAMYAPELKGNSDEFKTNVVDRSDEK